MKTINEKIRNTTKIICILVNIGRIICMVLAGIFVVALLFNLIFGFDASVLDSIKVLSQFKSTVGVTRAELNIFLVDTVVRVGLLVAILIIVSKIFTDIHKSGTPFLPKHPQRLKLVAILVICMAIMPSLVSFIFNLTVYGGSVIATFPVSIIEIIFGLIILSVAYIFEYGCRLQETEDTTL